MDRYVTSIFPDFFFTHKPSAYFCAEMNNCGVCEIYTEGGQFIGYGMFKDGNLLTQKEMKGADSK